MENKFKYGTQEFDLDHPERTKTQPSRDEISKLAEKILRPLGLTQVCIPDEDRQDYFQTVVTVLCGYFDANPAQGVIEAKPHIENSSEFHHVEGDVSKKENISTQSPALVPGFDVVGFLEKTKSTLTSIIDLIPELATHKEHQYYAYASDLRKDVVEALNQLREIKGLPLKSVSSDESGSWAETLKYRDEWIENRAKMYTDRIQQLEKELEGQQQGNAYYRSKISNLDKENAELKAALKHDVDKIEAAYIQQIDELKAKLEPLIKLESQGYISLTRTDARSAWDELKAKLDERSGR